MNIAEQPLTAEALGIDLSRLPALSGESSIRTNIADVGRTTLYKAATEGEIETVLLGPPGKRGKRLFVTASVVAWIIRRAETTKRPAMGARKSHAPVAA